jgi:sucrose-6-phosphatase
MTETRLLLCTDLDRTLIPNGIQAEHPQARIRFNQFCQRHDLTLVYVTGRDQVLVKQAIKNYQLPLPDFAITDVGSKIYKITDQQWSPWVNWDNEIEPDWNGFSHQQIKTLLSDITSIKLQELSKQNTHKLSYYLPITLDHNLIIAQIQEKLQQKGIAASLIWSIDEPNSIGLLDVLPQNATKLHAIKFLQQELGYQQNEVIFAGDSGNDLPVLGSDVRSILVANASQEIKQTAIDLAQHNHNSHALFIANNDESNNGNYAAGILQGIEHYAAAFYSQK